MTADVSARAAAPVPIAVRVGTLEGLFDPLEPGPLAARRVIESSVADYLRARLAEVPGEGDPVLRVLIDADAVHTAGEIEAATTAFRTAWARVLDDLERERSRDRAYGLRYLVGGMALLIIGFLLGQAGLLGVTGDDFYVLGSAVAVIGGVLVISAWVLIWEATAIAVFGHRDHNRQATLARRLGRATLVVEGGPG